MDSSGHTGFMQLVLLWLSLCIYKVVDALDEFYFYFILEFFCLCAIRIFILVQSA